MDESRVGTPKNNVGWYRSITWKTASAVGRPENNTASAPTRIGKYMLLPRPYAKNSFAAENVRSPSVIPRTLRAYVSAQTSMSPWRCTAPFGNPVDPDEYSQNATSSFEVSTASNVGASFRIHSSKATGKSPVFLPTTITRRTRSGRTTAALTWSNSDSETMTTFAPLSSRKKRQSEGLMRVFTGTGTA